MCKKQTSVSHSSTESEIISLDAGLRMHGLAALDLWDNAVKPSHDRIWETSAGQNPKTQTPTDKRKQLVDQVSDVEAPPS